MPRRTTGRARPRPKKTPTRGSTSKPKTTRRPPRRTAKPAPPSRRIAIKRLPLRRLPIPAPPSGPEMPLGNGGNRTPTPPALPVFELEPGTPQWVAYSEMVHRAESMLGATLEQAHRRLNNEGMVGERFTTILMRVRNMYDVPEFYAGLVVRSYPGYETVETEALGLRAFLRKRSQQRASA